MTVHAPLLAGENYPRAWGEPLALGPECKGLDGTYLNSGSIAIAPKQSDTALLMAILGYPKDATTVTLATSTRRIDKNGDAFITLRITTHDAVTTFYDREGCFCIRQTLACTKIAEKYWSLPNFGIGGSQSNAYFSVSQDHALIVKLQNYHADVVLGLPIFHMKEPWARFKNAER